MRVSPAILLLAAAFLAGCTQANPAPAPEGEADFDDLGLQADETTGVMRGVVIDDAIRPLVGVLINVTGTAAHSTTTNDEGLFGLSNLEPGTYFVSASKAGFLPTQQSVEVIAGVEEPPIVKILLTADATTAPFAQTHAFDGYIECSVSFVAAGLAACSAVGLPNDKFIVTYSLERPPQWIQSEMHWASTQAVSPELDLVYSAPGSGALLDNYAEDYGPSPLLIQVNQTLAANRSLGAGADLMVRVFNQPIEGTETGDPVGGDDCIDRPFLGGCTTGVGVTLQQRFTILTTVFYGYQPPADWLYVVDGPYPAPA